MFKIFVLLATFVLLLHILGCAPVGSRVSSAGAGTPIVQVYQTVPLQPTALPTDIATLPAATASTVPATATLPPDARVAVTQAPTPWIEATMPTHFSADIVLRVTVTLLASPLA